MLQMFKTSAHKPHDEAITHDRVCRKPVVIELIYLIATALFILSLKWLSAPTTARRGILAGEIGMALAIGGTLLHHGIVDYKWIIIGLVLGTDHRHSAGHGADDGGSAADRAQPCLRRSVRHARGHCGVLSAHARTCRGS